MRGLLYSHRSVYRGQDCMHCHRAPRPGESIVASTLYLYADGHYGARAKDRPVERELRLVYHRRCMEAILAKAPDGAAEADAKFEAFRARLLARYMEEPTT